MFVFRLTASVALAFVCFADDGGEGFCEAGAELFVVGDVEPGVERLAGEPAVGVARSSVSMVRVGQQPQAVMQEGPSAGVMFVVFRKTPVHVREARADAVLMPFQGGQVDGVGEVRREQLVAL
ncbi:hypothetical protein [Brooklawnia sp.]|uniref:hypothetical protein n=1 Tax=Brooklawnia sp. TaxID=2699740 RepID=UPI00311DCDBC